MLWSGAVAPWRGMEQGKGELCLGAMVKGVLGSMEGNKLPALGKVEQGELAGNSRLEHWCSRRGERARV